MAKSKKKDLQANLQTYLNKIDAAEKHRDGNYKVLWGRCYKRYRNYVDPLVDDKNKPIKGRSNISIPYTFTQVETILPRLVETMFAARPYITVKGRLPDDDPNASNMETLLDWQMNERFDLRKLFLTGLKELCIYGTTVAYTSWKLQERPVIKKQLMPVMQPAPDGSGQQQPLYDTHPTGEPKLDEQGKPVPVMDWQPAEVDEVEYDDPEVKFIDLGNFYVDTAAEDMNCARYAGHRSYESRKTIQEMHDKGIWKVDWSKIPKDNKRDLARDYRMNQVGLSTMSDEFVHTDEGLLYEVHHHFEDNKYVVIINRYYVARDDTSPFWHRKLPYVKEAYCEVPHEFYGMGVVEMLEDLQDELNNERNMRIDFRSFLLRRMWKVRRDSTVDRKQLVWRQNGIVEVEDMADVEEIGIKEVPNSTFTEEQTIKQDMRDTSGAQDVVMGASSGGTTATEAMRNDNNAAMRFKLIISSAEKSLLVGISCLMMQLNQQFIDSNRMIRLVGKDGDKWVKLTPEDIQGEMDLVAAGSSVEPQANKEAFKQRMVELYNIAVASPVLAAYPIYQRNLLKKVFEAFEIKNTDDLLPTDEELMGQQQQQIIQQFIATLPPQLQQLLASVAPPPAAPSGQPAGPPQIGGGANTAPQSEPALQLVGGGA